jgi:hypothetical protein
VIDAPPELKQRAVMLAAHYVLGEDIKDGLRELADALIWADIFDDAVFEAQDREFSDKIANAFFASLGLPLKSQEEAARELICHRLRALANGEVEPGHGMGRVVDAVYYGPMQHTVLNDDGTYSGDTFDISGIYNLLYELDDLLDMVERNGFTAGEAANLEIEAKAAIIAEAQRWINQHST